MTAAAAIYARFSTDLQDERSIDDQVALCREHAARLGLTVVEVHSDRARSGGSIIGRDGLAALMEAARAGAFAVVIVEALDRLSRDMEHLAGLYKRLTRLGVEIITVHEGAASTITIGLRGLVGQLYREDNAQKIRRGLAGRIRGGRSAGGRAYGYAKVPGDPGALAIVPAEAETVRRIFAELLANRSPRAIAHDLNADGVPPPRGRSWNASAINGNGKRGCGILRNELYVGRRAWNKVRMFLDPDTGKRISRPNPPAEWQVVEAPALAIVDPEVFEAVNRRRAALAQIHPRHQRRPRHLLSGLLRCASCGAGMSTTGKDSTGRQRLRCSAARESGTCPDPRTFYLATVERAVLDGLRAEMKAPKVLAEYVRAYHAERQRLAAADAADRVRLERRLVAVGGEADRVTELLIKGAGDEARLAARSRELAEEERLLQERLAGLDQPMAVVELHPSVLAQYEEDIGQLAKSLGAVAGADQAEMAERLRSMIESVTVARDHTQRGGVEVTISGRLTALLGPSHYPNGVRALGREMVAEDRYHHSAQSARFVLVARAA